MTRLTLILAFLSLLGTGCTSIHQVYVNGYSELAEPVDKRDPIYVRTDPNAQNPIFQRQIQAKAQRLLRLYEYAVVIAPEQAEYELDFRTGMASERQVDYVPAPGLYGGFYRRPWRGFGFGYDAYVPYADRDYDQWLVLRLFQKAPHSTGSARLVWVGDAMMTTETASPREAVNYLLVGAVDVLGVDTRTQLTMTIKADDPRLAEVAARE